MVKNNPRELAHKTYHDVKTYKTAQIYECFFSVKILNDYTIIATNCNGLYCMSENGCTYSHTSSQIYYIDTSPDGQLLIGGGILDGYETRLDTKLVSLIYGVMINLIILKIFNRNCCLSFMFRCRNWSDLNWAKISGDNKNLYGMNKAFTVNMFDIEKSNLIRDFYDETSQSFSRINSIALNGSDNILLSNGYLFCIRSGKLINHFDRFSPHISGIFMPSNIEILINTELWDLRTFKLLDRALHLKNVAVKRTFNDDILFGESVRKDYHICYLGHHLFNWGNFHPLLGDYIGLYKSKDLSQL
ncbi:hypothetical protein MXB_106, partial [Myxobolus squamalis]